MTTYPILAAHHLAEAIIVEHDPRGIKVMRLPNGDYLKVFRLRHRYGWARLHGYAQRFCKHAAKLKQLGISSVQIKQCYQVKDASLLQTYDTQSPHNKEITKHTYVVEYAPLYGDTLKHLLEKNALPDSIISQLGKFIAELHAKGVYFRSLHLGNIVLTPEGQLGLIDIADMDIYPWELWFTTKLRSFRHLTRYAKLNQAFGTSNWIKLLDSYFQYAKLGTLKTNTLKKKMQQYLLHPPH